METVTAQKDLLKLHYILNALTGRRQKALSLMTEAFQGGYGIPDLYMDVLQESLYEIGELWEQNKITVADEHLSTAITQFVMANLYQHLEVATVWRGRAVITGVEGELHQVGANMVSDVLEADGWNVIFLGANVPSQNVIDSLRLHHPGLLGISATLQANVSKVVDLVTMVRETFAECPQILLGGRAFRDGTDVPGLQGCLYARNLADALEVTRWAFFPGGGTAA